MSIGNVFIRLPMRDGFEPFKGQQIMTRLFANDTDAIGQSNKMNKKHFFQISSIIA